MPLHATHRASYSASSAEHSAADDATFSGVTNSSLMLGPSPEEGSVRGGVNARYGQPRVILRQNCRPPLCSDKPHTRSRAFNITNRSSPATAQLPQSSTVCAPLPIAVASLPTPNNITLLLALLVPPTQPTHPLPAARRASAVPGRRPWLPPRPALRTGTPRGSTRRAATRRRTRSPRSGPASATGVAR